jgi:hypothetical protein
MNTLISFHAVDHGCLGGVGLVEMRYKVWNETQGWSEWTYDQELDGETYQFEEQCKHYLVIEAWDCLGNKNVDNETFWVDDQPPLIEKIVGEPKFPYPFNGETTGEILDWWINCQTTITINATDMGCCGNLTNLSYRVNQGQWISIINENRPYTIPLFSECVHQLDIFAEDCLGNHAYHNETFYVDCTPPKINKTVGTPNCEIIPGKEYCVTTDTVITFNATDEGCMGGVGLKNLSYRIWNMSHGWGKWIDYVCVPHIQISFPDECKPKLSGLTINHQKLTRQLENQEF